MKRALCVLASGAALLLPALNAAASPQTPAQPAVANAAPAPAAAAAPAPLATMEDDEKIVCESVRYTGSRMPVRSCRTKRQIRLARENGLKTTEALQRKDRSLKRQRLIP